MALINLSQIKNGSELAKILKSYEASKVTTTIPKAGEGAGNYTVEELLVDLKAGIASGGDLGMKKVKDVVRLVLPVTSSTTGEGESATTTYAATLPEDLAAKVPQLDTSVALPVYTVDNRIVYDETGAQLTLNMATGAFSGVPSTLDVEQSKAQADNTLVYKPADLSEVKVFPTGEWTMYDLPTDALLDNTEMGLLAYDAAINKLVVELAKDEDLINSIKALVGEQAIADALAEKFDKANVVKSDVDRTAEGYEASDEKVLSEKAADAAFRAKKDAIEFEDLEENLQNLIRTAATPEIFDPTSILDEIDALKTGLAAAGKKEAFRSEKFDVTAAVSEFTLAKTPNTKTVHININGMVYVEGDEFTVDRENKKVTWTGSEETDSFAIDEELTSAIRIEYYTDDTEESSATEG